MTEIQYTIEEVKVPGYTTSISGSMKDGYIITNTPGVIAMPDTGGLSTSFVQLLALGLLLAGTLLMINKSKNIN